MFRINSPPLPRSSESTTARIWSAVQNHRGWGVYFGASENFHPALTTAIVCVRYKPRSHSRRE